MDGHIRHVRKNRVTTALLILVLIIGAALLITPVVAESVGAGISTGPAKVCPSAGCTCMPETQAEALGYVRCSANESPCFTDSFERPLYCFGPPDGTCDSPDSNGTSPGSEVPGTAGSGGFTLVITMQTPGAGDTSCSGTGTDTCALPEATPTSSAPESSAASPLTGILDFFRSLFGTG